MYTKCSIKAKKFISKKLREKLRGRRFAIYFHCFINCSRLKYYRLIF